MSIRALIPAMTAALAGVGLVASAAEPPDVDTLVHTSTIVDGSGVTPGGTVWVGVRFEIKDGWHTYWPGQNDTGLGTAIKATGPEGVTFGPVVWPAPTRHVAPGDILDHVHEHEVTAMIPVTAPAAARVGDTLPLSFDLEWLVCEAVCVPGWATVSLDLPVVGETGSPDPTAAAAFERARARVPDAIPNDDPPVTILWSGHTAEIRAGEGDLIQFYPDDRGSRVDDLLHAGSKRGRTLRLTLQGDNPRLSGVVEITRKGSTHLYTVRSSPEDGG